MKEYERKITVDMESVKEYGGLKNWLYERRGFE
jgi:hypothetical protein